MDYTFIPSDSLILEGYKKFNVEVIPDINNNNVLSYRKVEKGGMLLKVYRKSYFLVDFYDPHRFIEFLKKDLADSILSLHVKFKGKEISLPFSARHLDQNVFETNKTRCLQLLNHVSKKFLLFPEKSINRSNVFSFAEFIDYQLKLNQLCRFVNNLQDIDLFDDSISKTGYTTIPVLYDNNNKQIYF